MSYWQVQLDLIPDGSPLPGLWKAFILCPHPAEKEEDLSSSSYKATNFIIRVLPSWPQLTLISSKGLICKYYFIAGWDSTYEFWGYRIQASALLTKKYFEMSRKISFPDFEETLRFQQVLSWEYWTESKETGAEFQWQTGCLCELVPIRNCLWLWPSLRVSWCYQKVFPHHCCVFLNAISDDLCHNNNEKLKVRYH